MSGRHEQALGLGLLVVYIRCRNSIQRKIGAGSSQLGLVLEEIDFEGFIRPQQIRYYENERAAQASSETRSTGGVYPAPQFDTAKNRRRVTRSAVWSGREDSNLRPLRPERSALPGCATPRQNQQNYKASGDCLTSRGRNASHGHRPPLDK